MKIIEARNQYRLTQQEASEIVGMPLRTFIRYEKDDNYGNIMKRDMIVHLLQEACAITEDKGILTLDVISKEISSLIESKYADKISFCYLFGSYAKGKATEKSDVDLLVSTTLSGLEYIGLAEEIREILHKPIDLLRISDLRENPELVNEILKYGVKIYG